jgi:hypothetical protein
MFNKFNKFLSENGALYEIMWKYTVMVKMVKPDRRQMPIS